jgi:hypothetical protein
MATNFADLATMYWGQMRHYEKQANERGDWLHNEAIRRANQTYRPHTRDTDAYLAHVEVIENDLVDTDRPRTVLIGKQQFAQRMHDSCVLQALLCGHKPTKALQVKDSRGWELFPIGPFQS